MRALPTGTFGLCRWHVRRDSGARVLALCLGLGTPRPVRELLLEDLDARALHGPGRVAAVVDLGERVDLLIEAAHPLDANRKLIKDRRHERAALFTFLTTDGVDATRWRGEQV